MTKPKPAPAITPEQRLAVVRHLANGRGLDFTAAACHLTADEVREIGSEHGWPREESLAKAADVLARNLDRDAKAQITPRPDLERVATLRESRNENRVTQNASRSDQILVVRTADNDAATPRGATPHGVSPGNGGKQFDATAALLLRGSESPRKRTQALAQKISDNLADLRDRLEEEDRERRETERAAEAAAEARAEVERLEKELREAKARARGHNKGYARTPNVQPRTETVQPTSRRGLSPGDFTCPEPGCGRHFTSAQGLGGHKAQAHRAAS